MNQSYMDILRELEIFESFEKKMEHSNQTAIPIDLFSDFEGMEGVDTFLTAEEDQLIESFLNHPSNKLSDAPPVIVEPVEPAIDLQYNFTDLSPAMANHYEDPAMADHYEEIAFVATPANIADSENTNTDGSYLLTESGRPTSTASSEYSNADITTLTDPNLINFNFEVNQVEPVATQILQQPEQVVEEEKKPKKRGRKPKSENGLTIREQRRQKRVKVYEMPPLVDSEMEKKRKNALNAKRHRDLAKQRMLEAEATLEQVKRERDQLKMEVEQLKKSEFDLKLQLQLRNQNSNIIFQAYVQS